jgi:A118 family predicted phage portal protein
MPLPDNPKQAWPPENWQGIYSDYAENAAWYSGDPLALSNLYALRCAVVPAVAQGFFSKNTVRPSGKFWAKQTWEERRVMLHVPVAGDISSVSASMLFSSAPRVKIAEAQKENAPPDAMAAQERLDEIIDRGGIQNTLLEAAESCSGMGGVLLKVNWDAALSSLPLLSVAQADNALPEFKFGTLTACTFWKTVGMEDDGGVYRLLERHEPGVIYQALYYSKDAEKIGTRQALVNHPETAGMQDVIQTGLDGLACVYIPNMRPNRRRRGEYIGQSDYSGSEGLMDSIDEIYTSLLRDVRLGQGRLIVPSAYLSNDGDGGLRFDADKEAFSPVDAPLGGGGMASEITINQFAIRTTEHLDAIKELLMRTFSNAGYAPQTFGLSAGGGAEAEATLRMRQAKTSMTTAKKAQYWADALEYIFGAMLVVDQKQLGTKVTPYPVSVEMQDGTAVDMGDVATSIELLNRAAVTSLRTRVAMVHPDWTREQIDAEALAIEGESGLSVPDPAMVGRGAADGSGTL